MLENNEYLKEIPEYPGYFASNLGRIFSTKRKGKFLKLSNFKNTGYKKVTLSKNGKQKTFFVHQLIALTFLSDDKIDKNMVVDHINGIKDDNRVENLRWVISANNAKNRDNNNDKIYSLIPKLIQKYGYEKSFELISSLL